MGVALLPDWVAHLSLQQQAVLVLALRGPDGFAKRHPSKLILWRYRACLLKNAKTGRAMAAGDSLPSFMIYDFSDAGWKHSMEAFQDVEDELPLHYYAHLMHGAQILAYKYPDEHVRGCWLEFYKQCCDYLHAPPETEEAMDQRLDDNLAKSSPTALKAGVCGWFLPPRAAIASA